LEIERWGVKAHQKPLLRDELRIQYFIGLNCKLYPALLLHQVLMIDTLIQGAQGASGGNILQRTIYELEQEVKRLGQEKE
jgi:hypothetical protein